MVKRDREFEILLKDFLRTEGKNFSSKEEAIEVFERLYDLVEEGYSIDTPLGDIVDSIDEGEMSAIDKLSALRELHEENKDALERAIRLGEDIMYSDNDEDTEQMILADVLAGYYREAGMYNEAAKLYKFMLAASQSDFSEVTDELTKVYVHLNSEGLMQRHIECFDYEKSEVTLLLLSIFSINRGKLDEAHYYMTNLKKLNTYTGNIFKGGFKKVSDYIIGAPDNEKGANKEKTFEIHYAAIIAEEYLLNRYHYEILERLYKSEMERREYLIVEGRFNTSKEMMKKDSIFAGMER